MNIMQLMQMIRNVKNPQQAIIDMLNQQSCNNPVLNNALQMLKSGDNAGIERLARNICNEKHINPDDMITQIRNQLRI